MERNENIKVEMRVQGPRRMEGTLALSYNYQYYVFLPATVPGMTG